MIGNARQHVSEPGAWIDIVQFGGDDQGIHRSCAFATTVGTREQPCFSAQGNHPFILPMSGKSWKSIIRGIRFSDIRSLFGG